MTLSLVLCAFLHVGQAAPETVMSGTRARLVSDPLSDSETTIAAARSNGTSLFVVIDEERGTDQAAGLVCAAVSGSARVEQILTSTLVPLDEAHAKPPFFLGPPLFVAAASISASRFLVVGRELTSSREAFIAEIDVLANRTTSRYLPELSEQDVRTDSAMIGDGRGGAWLFFVASDGALKAMRYSDGRLRFIAALVASRVRGFEAVLLPDGRPLLTWIASGAIHAAVIGDDGVIEDVLELHSVGATSHSPRVAFNGTDVATVWSDEGRIDVGRWNLQGECIEPVRSLETGCPNTQAVRIGVLGSEFVVAWRCFDSVGMADLTGSRPLRFESDEHGSFFDMDCSAGACAIWWQDEVAGEPVLKQFIVSN